MAPVSIVGRLLDRNALGRSLMPSVVQYRRCQQSQQLFELSETFG